MLREEQPVRCAAHICAACGKANSQASLFCDRCTAPLGVVALQALDDADQARCVAALIDVLSNSPREISNPHEINRDLWHAYLSAFWLRPETALVLYCEAIAIASLNRSKQNWLDLGCGDGIHAAIYSGWRFDKAFDAFQSLDLSANDIYNRFDASDFAAPIGRRGKMVARGIDIKPTAVARAKSLGIFDQIAVGDATKIPLPDASVSTIFSNMLRDLDAPLPAALIECRRVLRRDGRLLISAMTAQYPDHLYFAPAARRADAIGDSQKARELLKLDRGRSVFCRRQLSIEQWNELLAPANLEIESVTPIVGQHIMKLWDVGLRPFTSTLLRWRQTWIDSDTILQVKASATQFVDQILSPYLNAIHAGETSMHLLCARPR